MGYTDEQRFMNLYRIMKKTRKNKRRGKDSVEFEANWTPLLIRAMNERNDRTLRIRRNYTFLTPRPRWREIFATEFGGRMIDHEICEVVIPAAESFLSPYTYNNRKGMGSQKAINQLMEHIFEVTEGFTKPARIVKIDFKGYFPNALWNVAEEKVCDIINGSWLNDEDKDYLKWLAMVSIHCNPAAHCDRRTDPYLWQEHIEEEKSLFNKPVGTGAAIGRLIWQTSMGLYVNDEILWLTNECGIRLVCFVDDIVMVVPEERHQYLLSLLPELRRRLATKNVKLNEKKFYDQPATLGCEFLGSHIKPNRIHLNNSAYGNALKSIRYKNGLLYKNIDAMLSTFNSYSGLLKNRCDYKRLIDLRNKLSDDWWQWLEWNDRKKCLSYREGFSEKARLNRKYKLNLKVSKNEQNRIRRAA